MSLDLSPSLSLSIVSSLRFMALFTNTTLIGYIYTSCEAHQRRASCWPGGYAVWNFSKCLKWFWYKSGSKQKALLAIKKFLYQLFTWKWYFSKNYTNNYLKKFIYIKPLRECIHKVSSNLLDLCFPTFLVPCPTKAFRKFSCLLCNI